MAIDNWPNTNIISSSSLREALGVANRSKSLPNMWNKLELKHQIFASAVTFQRDHLFSKYPPNLLQWNKTRKIGTIYLMKINLEANMFVKNGLTVSVSRGCCIVNVPSGGNIYFNSD